MKNYSLIFKDKKTKKIVYEFTEHAKAETILRKKYDGRLTLENLSLKITRIVKSPGIQMDLEEMIKDIENAS